MVSVAISLQEIDSNSRIQASDKHDPDDCHHENEETRRAFGFRLKLLSNKKRSGKMSQIC
jgi:hypothetical protein